MEGLLRTYALTSLVLVAKIFFATFRVSFYRFKYRTFKYAEDYGKPVEQLSEKSKQRIEKGKPLVEKALALHYNDLENLPVYWVVALLFAALLPSHPWGAQLMWFYTVTRCLHTAAYVLEVQPWRFIFHACGMGTLLYMTGAGLWALLH